MLRPRPRIDSGLLALVLVAVCFVGLSPACSAPPEAPSKSAPQPAAKSSFDPCEGSKPPWRAYTGPLRGVRCEQEQFLRMATIATEIGVECDYCHQPKDPNNKKAGFNYEELTPNKSNALWMGHHFVDGLKQKDGGEVRCKSCHMDEKGKASPKFLGDRRKVEPIVAWMTTVMSNRFTLSDGSKPKCKTCHEAGWGTDGFKKEVIGRPLPFAPPPVEVTPVNPPVPGADGASAPDPLPPASSSADATVPSAPAGPKPNP